MWFVEVSFANIKALCQFPPDLPIACVEFPPNGGDKGKAYGLFIAEGVWFGDHHFSPSDFEFALSWADGKRERVFRSQNKNLSEFEGIEDDDGDDDEGDEDEDDEENDFDNGKDSTDFSDLDDVDDVCILDFLKKNMRFDSHYGCYCKEGPVCGCGCDPKHDGW